MCTSNFEVDQTQPKPIRLSNLEILQKSAIKVRINNV